MTGRTREELYLDFIDFVEKDTQRERTVVNRRMVSVFFWCFLLPAAISASALMLIKFKILPFYVRTQLDWLVLLFPVIYSLFVLGNEVIPKFPHGLKKGVLVRTLYQASKEGKWRERVSLEMAKAVNGNEDEWRWIILSFRMDLEAMEYRNRYLTALAGAVFFLLMQGIDSLVDTGGTSASVIRQHLASRPESNYSDFTQFVGLGLFLTLLYLSGNQTYHSLLRYLNCAQLALSQPDRRRH